MDPDKHLSVDINPTEESRDGAMDRTLDCMLPSGIEGGVFLCDLEPGSRLELETYHHRYSLRNLGEGKMEISGHPQYCPEPTEVDVLGSSWGGTLLKSRYVGRGMRLEFWHPCHDLVVTSPILEMHQIA